jgi:hypothetical protein
MNRLLTSILVMTLFLTGAHAQNTCQFVTGASFVADDGTFLGKATNSYASDSILNEFGSMEAHIRRQVSGTSLANMAVSFHLNHLSINLQISRLSSSKMDRLLDILQLIVCYRGHLILVY